MKCPKCGRELRKSELNPLYGLCDACKLKFNLENEEYNRLPQKKKFGCLGWGVIFLTVIIGIFVIYMTINSGSENRPQKNTESETNIIDLDQCYNSLKSQETALYDLYNRWVNEEEDSQTASKKLSGLADGIQNTIDTIQRADNSDYKTALEALATTYKGIAKRYSDYVISGDQSKIDDANNLISELDRLKLDVENSIK